MPKDAIKLTAKDIKLIRELEKNSRASISRMAKASGVSKEVAGYRLRRLEEAGFIRGYRLIVDYSMLGFQLYRLLLNLYNIEETTKERMIADLRKSPTSSFNALLQSFWDMEVIVRSKSTLEFQKFYEEFVGKHSRHIYDSDFSLVTKTYFLGHPYIHRHRNPLVVGQQSTQEADETDFALIELLSRNSRMELTGLARKLRLAPNTVQYRLRSLMSRGVIKGFRPVLSGALIGYNRYKIAVMLHDLAAKKSIVQFLVMMPNTVKIVELIGKYDMEIQADFRSPLELEEFLLRLRTKFHEIKNYDVIPVFRDDMQHVF